MGWAGGENGDVARAERDTKVDASLSISQLCIRSGIELTASCQPVIAGYRGSCPDPLGAVLTHATRFRGLKC